ncbi:hypothetical protein KDA82_40085, partial [Streptomyces daliensis]|nr:hypothetical protein [Streptomyces daliensis]
EAAEAAGSAQEVTHGALEFGVGDRALPVDGGGRARRGQRGGDRALGGPYGRWRTGNWPRPR